MIHEITKSVDQASNLSKELLAFSRQDTGVRLEPLNFTEEVRNAVSIVRQLAPAAITLKTEITEEPLYVLGRRRMAEHILLNLSKKCVSGHGKDGEKGTADTAGGKRGRYDLSAGVRYRLRNRG